MITYQFILIHKFLLSIKCCRFFLLESTILRPRVNYDLYGTLLDQSHCRYFVRY